MSSPATLPRGRRPLLSFSVEGLPARDELLFKSLVRLLDHRTQQHWAWQVEGADLRVVGDRLPEPPAEADDRSAPLLTIGENPPSRGPFLRLPLHADALETMLNRLGAMVIHARELGLAASRDRAAERGEEYRLLRWPSLALLETTMRMKLATLLASRPASLQALQQRSGASAQECADFIAALEKAGFVTASSSNNTSNSRSDGTGFAASRAPESIWPDSQASTGSDASHVPAVARDTVQPGLLARIRSRLGLLASGPRA